MKTYLFRIIKIVVVLICILSLMSNLAVFAYNVKEKFSGQSIKAASTLAKVRKVLSTILDIVRYIGIGIALIILMYIGAKFMLAAPSERANIKQYLMNYVIGAFILIGASGIITIIQNFTKTSITA